MAPDSEQTTALETAAREVFAVYGFSELRLPTLERRDLFVKSTGENTDIVEKEMFQFEDAGGRHVALRPEGTPGVVRAYIDKALRQSGAISKLFYIGSMFRAERPQAGRYREFIQIGVETIGNPHPAADVECILALRALYDKIGLGGKIRVRLNNLGCDESPDCRPLFHSKLKDHLKGFENDLCDNCRRRMLRNPLRALDCKKDGPRLAEKAPRLHPCGPCRDHVAGVSMQLDANDCPHSYPDPNLVRGLDYYTRTVFEFQSEQVGSQDALAGGGRYDRLIGSMGGKPAPAVGWALGVERSLMAVRKADPGAARLLEFLPPQATDAFVATADRDGVLAGVGMRLLEDLRRFGIRSAGGLFASSLKAQMKEAGRRKARFAVILGGEELRKMTPTAILKDMSDGTQSAVEVSALIETIGDRLIGASRLKDKSHA